MPRTRKSSLLRKCLHSAPATWHVFSSWSSKRKKCAKHDYSTKKREPLWAEHHEISRVLRSTLHDRIWERVVHEVKLGPKPCLNEAEEKELKSYLKHCAKVGYGKTKNCGWVCKSLWLGVQIQVARLPLFLRWSSMMQQQDWILHGRRTKCQEQSTASAPTGGSTLIWKGLGYVCLW